MNMDLRQIRCLVAIVEEGSIAGAARRLNVVQPAVSMTLRKLEEDFGVILFERTARGVEASQKALALYKISLQILEQFAAANQLLQSETEEVESTLIVGTLPSGSHSFIPRAISEVYQRYPNCRVISREGFNDELLDHVSQGVVDIALVSTIYRNERLPSEYIGSERLMLVGGADSDVGDMDEYPGSRLSEKRLVTSPRLRRRFEEEFARAGIVIKPSIEVESSIGIFGMLHQPGWYSVLPASALCGIASGEFRMTPVSEPAIERDRWLVRSTIRPLSEEGFFFREVIRRLFAENPFCTLASQDDFADPTS